jgi:hypothetical protein
MKKRAFSFIRFRRKELERNHWPAAAFCRGIDFLNALHQAPKMLNES